MNASLIDVISGIVPAPEAEYLGNDGLMHCARCKARVQTEITLYGKRKLVRCICDCEKKKMEAEKEAERCQEIERRRKQCFSSSNMESWTFENDDCSNQKMSDAMKRYVENFTDFRSEGRGLLLYGTVGTGKTYYAACIANSLIDKGYSCLMTNFARLTNQIQGLHEDKQTFIDDLDRYSLLIIDDLGAERESSYMQEMVFNIIDSRYRSGLPLIVTSNLTAEEIKKPKNIECQRIYDRILERCFPVEISGGSRRRDKVKDSFADIRARLGL